jgi:DNA-binding SARP family transcriptional activator/tetratricopeptide (TPR) repeat protein/transcriptional regulator with XRE-family HTH domain
MRFALLGPLRVMTEPDGSAAGPGQPAALPPRLRVLLAALLLRANSPVPVSELTELVWDGSPPGRAPETLRAYVMRLRRALGPALARRIVTRSPGYLIEVDDHEFDVRAFEERCGQARAAASLGSWPRCSELASQALALWSGSPLADIPSQALHDIWVPRLEELRLQALGRRIDSDLHLGRHDQLVPELRDLTREHPFREHLHAQLMSALARAGRRAEALAAFQQARLVLVNELGVEPGPELQERQREILSGAPLPRPEAVGQASDRHRGKSAGRDLAAARDEPTDLSGSGGPLPRSDEAGKRYTDADGNQFGSLLRRLRSEALLTQKEMARRSGLSVRTIINMERGHSSRPFSRSVRLLADALGLDVQVRAQLIAAACAGPGVQDAPAPEPGGAIRPRRVMPRQLPTPVSHFSGRSAELGQLASLLDQLIIGRAAVIAAITGTAGVGKTTLGVYWAHHVADQFPDGQLYVNLRGFDASGRSTTPEEAIRGFLDSLGVRPDRVPAGLEAQSALYRSLLARKRMLIVADNALDEQQVRPLLPGAGENLIIVTSRSQLTGLIAVEGAHHVGLDVMSDTEAWQLLVDRLGTARLASEPEAADELIGLCAHLPLALAIAAARAAVRPASPLAAVAAGLRDTRARLDALDDTDPSARIRSVFSWSYQNLSVPGARMFRLLGVHPGPDISVQAAASLAAADVPQARILLRELAGSNLLAEAAPDRFGLHDLLRAYAAEQTQDDERTAATGRVFDHCLHTAHGAALLLSPSRDSLSLAAPAAGTRPEHLGTYQQAMAWFAAERRGLLAVADLAATAGSDSHAWQLPLAMETFLERQGYWRDLEATHCAALAAAVRLGDLAGQAHTHRTIGNARFFLSSYDEAEASLAHALDLYRQLGDRISAARAHIDIARVLELLGRHAEALEHSSQALDLFREKGHEIGQTYALNAVGWYLAHLGDQDEALDRCQQALELARGIGDQVVVACVWDSLGYVRHQLGQFAEAISCYQNALRMCRELGNLHNQAEVLSRLGDVCRASGDDRAAGDAYRRALVILDRLGHRDAAQVRASLADIGIAG